jgi:hypothetical protein
MVLTVVAAFGVLGQRTILLRLLIATVLYWAAVLVATRRVQAEGSVGAAWFLTAVPCALSLFTLVLFLQHQSGSVIAWLDGVLFPLAVGVPGVRCLVLATRYRKLARLCA